MDYLLMFFIHVVLVIVEVKAGIADFTFSNAMYIIVVNFQISPITENFSTFRKIFLFSVNCVSFEAKPRIKSFLAMITLKLSLLWTLSMNQFLVLQQI